MKYQLGQKSKQRRDWTIVMLLWSNIGLLLIIAWLWLKCYTGGF